ncbi:uncharacterized protein [Prorops nasuta]|uniref:uncharacterized protein n=1 Tax=Prorops nasuta TaxID=863751 RepID=UPI0034D01394
MDSVCQNSDSNVQYLLTQLNTARKEINNLRQQIKSLKYIHEKDIENIKSILELKTGEITMFKSAETIPDEVKPSTSFNDDTIHLKPIGIISTCFPKKRGTPRQPSICEKAPGKIVFHNSIFTNPDHALEGLHGFSHMWILFHFHKNDAKHVRAKVAPPRLNGCRIGVFSTRSPHRPCPIGLSLVKIVKIENCTIYFEGVDMVDQTPVLDIKPYIPVYDNPTNIEILSNSYVESNLNNTDIYESIDVTLNEASFRNQRLDSTAIISLNDRSRMISESFFRNGVNEVIENTDISRDEEIALRLQAEEFEANPNFEDYNNSRHYLQFPDDTLVNNDSFESDSNNTLPRIPDIIHNISPNINQSFSTFHSREETANSDLESASNSVRNVLQNMNINEPNIEESVNTLRAANNADIHVSRNSRLLDGADGPNTICGTDLDLTHNRVLHSRIDNSPIRMGIREAPDGEEGYESQGINSSQTFSNIQLARSVSNITSMDGVDEHLAPSTELRNGPIRSETNFSEVRVPDWISQTRIGALSVVFNDRALAQLNEILEDKANEQKYAIESVLREDPRSVYLRQRWGNQFYTFLIHDLHITCKFDDNRGIVTVFQIRHAGRTCECGEPEWQCLGHSPQT